MNKEKTALDYIKDQYNSYRIAASMSYEEAKNLLRQSEEMIAQAGRQEKLANEFEEIFRKGKINRVK